MFFYISCDPHVTDPFQLSIIQKGVNLPAWCIKGLFRILFDACDM